MVEAKRETGPRDEPDRRQLRRWVPALAGWLALRAGLLDVVGAIKPEWHHRMLVRVSDVVPGALLNVARTAPVITGLLMLLLSHALRRRKRRAWRAVVALLAVSIVLHIMKNLAIGEGVVAALMLATLIHYPGEVYAVRDPTTPWRAPYPRPLPAPPPVL